MPIECENCQGTDFQVQDGATFCLICGTESQEHGMETVVDAETMGAFGDHATGLKKKAISDPGSSRRRRKRQKLDRCRVKFTSINVFSFILRGWVQDVAAADVGVDEKNLSDIVLALWARYLAKLNLAFVRKDPGLSKYPAFRDVQVRITNRRRLITPKKISDFIKKSQSSKAPSAVESESFQEDDMSTESRRKKAKLKRKFLDSFASDTSSIGNSSSFLSMSETSDDASDTSEYESEEDRPDNEEAAIRAMSRLTVMKKSTKRFYSVESLKLRTVYALFCLGVLMSDKNSVTLSDLLRYAKNNVISFATSSQHVPTAMKLKRNFDVGKFTGNTVHLYPLNHFEQRRAMTKLGNFLKLEKAGFGKGIVKTVIKQYLREFSLPKCLHKMIFHCLEHTDLYELEMLFDQARDTEAYVSSAKDNFFRPLVSADVRALAIILMALKYLYGVDDVSEVYRAPKDDGFSICKWIRLSRHRVVLASKMSMELNERFQALLNFNVELTRPAWYAAMKCERQFVSEKRNWKESGKTHRFFSNEKLLANTLGQALKTKSLREQLEKCPVNNFKCRKAKMPLHAFTLHYINEDKLEANEERLNCEDRQALRELLAMQSKKVSLRDVPIEAVDVEAEPTFVMFAHMPIAQRRNNSENVVYTCQPSAKVEDGKIFNFKPTYWIAEMAQNGLGHKAWQNHTTESNNYLMTILPENFGWILRYFAVATDIAPTEIYAELLHVEKTLLSADKKIFGSLIRSTDSVKGCAISPQFKDRLSLIE